MRRYAAAALLLGALSGCFNLDTDRIVLVVDARAPAFARTPPFRPYDNQQNIVLVQLVLDLLAKIDPDELTEARWLTAAELRTAGEWGGGDEGTALKLPRRDSIARRLMEDWLAGRAG